MPKPMPGAGGVCPLKSAAVAVGLLLARAGPAAAQAATPFPLGVYIGNPNIDSQSEEAQFDANYASFVGAMNAQPLYYNVFIDYTQPVDAWVSNAGWDAASRAASPVASKLQPVIALPMYSTASGAPTPDQQFQAFAAGQYDGVLTSIVQNWVQTGGVTAQIFRVGWEMNLNGTPYFVGSDAQSQSDWVTAFRHIHDVLEQAGATYGATITIVWNPGATNYSAAHATANLYPGDRYVNLIGIDIYGDMYPYSDGGDPPTYHDWDTGQEDTSLAQFIADPINRHHYWTWPAATEWSLNGSSGNAESFEMLAHFAIKHAKPIAIPETGAGNSNGGHDVVDDPTFPAWLSQKLRAAVKAGGSVAFVDIWDSNGGGNYEFSYSADNKPQEQAAWRGKFGN